MQGRFKNEDVHYNNLRYVLQPYITSIPSTMPPLWLSEQTTQTEEGTAKIGWKPVRWFQPSFRYQLVDQGLESYGYPQADGVVDTAQISNVFTWDLTSQPVDALIMTASFSYQNAKVITPSRFIDIVPAIPSFDYDSYSSLFSVEYEVKRDVILTGTADYIRAANYNDFSANGFPYGADFHEANLTFGLRWTPKKDLTVEPKYAWYQYTANQSEMGSYNASLISLEVKNKW
jgi:hypothetical protein